MFRDLMTREFEMIKYAFFSYDDIENMAMSEFGVFYNILLDNVKAEKEAHEQAVARARHSK
jgi:hypothetical protein